MTRNESWIDLHQTKTKVISGPFYRYRPIHFSPAKTRYLFLCL